MGKQISTILAVVLLIAPTMLAQGAVAATSTLSGQFVADPLTGVALEGYDPVSYFTEGEPLPGQPEFDYYWQGVPWYFASAANRDAFARSPETFVPVFGGYGVMSLSRGFLSAGNPRLYAVLAGHVFLFHSSGNREAFLLAPRESYKLAERQWPTLSAELDKSGM